ncbi:response regulator [Mastigocladopsis repens]|uniref:response regulator n=1 Tax=Mastigocladopsis repens TaxID=221287 RepID=UPI0002FA2EE4|nr:response regulator [Mastigocladopsis repens]
MSKPVILCVDDEKVILESLKAQLKSAFGNAYQYEVAEDANEALELIYELTEERIKIILIVSDWLMPGMKGDDFLIRVHREFPYIIKIMLTGQADEASIERAKKYADLHCCISKPWSEADLVEAIKSAMAKL